MKQEISKYKTWNTIFISGLWQNNQALVAMLGLCPLLAVSNSFINALSLGLATMVVLIISNIMISLTKNLVAKEIRIPFFVGIIAIAVTLIEIFFHAYLFELYNILGIFIPLIVTNCIILARAESFAKQNNIIESTIDAISIGLGFLLVLLLLGSIREIIGQGTIFANMYLLFPNIDLTITINDSYPKILFFILPSGSFLTLSCLIAFKNYLFSKNL